MNKYILCQLNKLKVYNSFEMMMILILYYLINLLKEKYCEKINNY